jgi:hypothetical protein
MCNDIDLGSPASLIMSAMVALTIIASLMLPGVHPYNDLPLLCSIIKQQFHNCLIANEHAAWSAFP